jgi:DnaJ-class molecular chaperone
LIIIPILKRQRQPLFNCNFRLVYCSAWRRTYGKYFDGKVKLKVTEGTQNDTKVKLKGKGFPVYKRGQFGDLYINYQIQIQNISEKEKLFTQLANLQNHDCSKPNFRRYTMCSLPSQ